LPGREYGDVQARIHHGKSFVLRPIHPGPGVCPLQYRHFSNPDPLPDRRAACAQ
jgi:hypothetical protein